MTDPANTIVDADPYSTFVSEFDRITKAAIMGSGSMNDREVAIVNALIERLVELDPASEQVLDPT